MEKYEPDYYTEKVVETCQVLKEQVQNGIRATWLLFQSWLWNVNRFVTCRLHRSPANVESCFNTNVVSFNTNVVTFNTNVDSFNTNVWWRSHAW